MADSKKNWPSWRYGPNGESRIFQENDVIPKGWEDHPDKVQQPSALKVVGKQEKKDEKKVLETGPTPEEKANTIKDIREAAAARGIDVTLADDASVEEINAAIDKLTQE